MSLEVTVTSLGARGDGVTEDGLYVPFTLPGERVLVDPVGDRARLIRVIELSAERVAPCCKHFGECGGCALQHASDELVQAWKTSLITDALSARGIDDVPVRPMLTSPPGSRRRITATARRTKKSVQIGFHAGQSDRIVPVTECPVTRTELIEILPSLEELVMTGASRKGEIRLALTATSAGVDLSITDAKEMDGPGRALLAGAANRAGLARLSWNDDVAVTRRSPSTTFGRARVGIPAGGFLQATEEGQTALIAAVTEAVDGSAMVVDLYAGAGTFSLPLAASADIRAFEADPVAVDALDRAWRVTEGMRSVVAQRRNLVRRPLLPAEFSGVDAVVIDPPRAGARAQFEHLATSGVRRIASVSCNPATFARDARILIDGGYSLDWIQPVDQFRWAAHVELAAQFTRETG
ncbi:MAG: class I SAM-dependent RNA methyltransferase [Pseudomonadota bacterium]